MTQQDMYLHRAEQGATLTLGTIIAEVCNADERTQHEASVIEYGGEPIFPTVEDLATAHQTHFYPNPQLYKIVDAYDAYLWRALAESERQMIDLINAGRPRLEGNRGAA